ncbi:hypothetical protein B0J15DRAFT_572491 [Fusarium solani]|uniref:Geranylgeranyl pyrophosphate synthetase n=1 Tax=Fusarium solani TaxID=169388 RepID=A0A9P9G5R6_FUSSL|nr:uncharacterized protein B0J15DRAFT_572491 [Fusarium solani]KAH7232502.1 hypothetical protein B0J15DRAFT_572491 [Fusarium solani]
MASTIVAEISRIDLQDLSVPPAASITNVRHLSSYNWIERPTPTIAVPGSPRLWSAPKVSRQLNKDSGLVYIDQNGARHPGSPIEPLFRALYMMNPSFDIRSVDVVTDRNNIRKLLSFVNPNLTPNELEPFTIGIEITGTTAIFCREETAASRTIGPLEFRGFGHEFEKAYTINQINGSTGHHRIISYQLGDLNFIVRYEADGYVAADIMTQFPGSEKPEDDHLSSMMGTLSLSSTSNALKVTPTPVELTVKKEGRTIPLESILEIKTRTSSKRLPIHEVAPQLWVSQTFKLVRAYHNRGKFQAPLVENVAAQVKRWEELNQMYLKELAALIKKISDVVKRSGGKATVRYDGGNKLLVCRADRKEMLPNVLYSKWDDRSDSQAAANVDHDAEGENASRAADQAETKASGECPAATKGTYETYGDVPYSEVISNGVDNGFRQFFRRMPTQLSQYHVLCDTLDSLAIDVIEGRTIRDVMDDMRRGKSDWDPDERREIEGLKSIARDSAFRLLYMFLQSDVGNSNMAYNATLFVVSHSRIFKYRTRKMVREAFTERFPISGKQRTGLDKWPVKDSSLAGSQEDDVTTEAEEDVYFDSDSSF